MCLFSLSLSLLRMQCCVLAFCLFACFFFFSSLVYIIYITMEYTVSINQNLISVLFLFSTLFAPSPPLLPFLVLVRIKFGWTVLLNVYLQLKKKPFVWRCVWIFHCFYEKPHKMGKWVFYFARYRNGGVASLYTLTLISTRITRLG